MKTTQLLFSYGTLQEPEIQEKILNRRLKGTKAILLGYKKYEKRMMNKYPIIEQSDDAKAMVSGILYKVSNYELYKIDLYESLAYTRIQAKLKSSVKAWVYIPDLD